MLILKCSYCQKIFNRFPSRVRSNFNYCSPECSKQDQSVRQPKQPPEKRFWEQVQKTDTCWLWNGSLGPDYGHIQVNGKQVGAHCFSWELHYGAIPEGFWVLHKCDVRTCVRPDHLFLGTAHDNTADMMTKKRHRFGEAHYLSKLTEENVREIRSAYDSEGISMAKLGQRFGVCAEVVHGIVHRVRWKHVS